LVLYCGALAATVLANLLAVKFMLRHAPVVPDLPAD
jgi:hypothetical protein